MAHIHSFPPISASSAEILILGSMPGKASLRANQYYAHPRNMFWRIIEALFEVESSLPYERRCEQLIGRRLAVWDVLKTCTRSGSLDSDIEELSIVPNDFPAFYEQHPRVRSVFFNGIMAEKTYRKHVLRNLPEEIARLPAVRVPSTSPANAGMSYHEKLAKWRIVGR